MTAQLRLVGSNQRNVPAPEFVPAVAGPPIIPASTPGYDKSFVMASLSVSVPTRLHVSIPEKKQEQQPTPTIEIS